MWEGLPIGDFLELCLIPRRNNLIFSPIVNQKQIKMVLFFFFLCEFIFGRKNQFSIDIHSTGQIVVISPSHIEICLFSKLKL
jgi:hypothetical protein